MRRRASLRWSSTVRPDFSAAHAQPAARRSVSMNPGSRLFTVTLLSTTSRPTPARNAVRPARAPDDRSRPGIGVRTEKEVMLTIRPNRRSTMPSMTDRINSSGVTMFWVTPSTTAVASTSRNPRRGGPALLLTRTSGSGQADKSAARPSGDPTSAATGVTFTEKREAMSSAVAASVASSRPLITTSQPASASASAQPRPRPRLDAHTIALRPPSPRSMGPPSSVDLARDRRLLKR